MKSIIQIIYFTIFSFCLAYAQFNNIRVTTDPYNQSETTIAVSPSNPNIVLAAWNDFRLINNNQWSKPGFGFSTDAGQNWFDDIHLPPGTINGFDPSVAFDRYGNAYYCYIGTISTLGAVWVSRTTDLSPPFLWDDEKVSTANTGQDKPWITVDNSGSIYDGRLYFSWTDLNGPYSKIKFRYSSDQGNTFSNEFTVDQINEYPGDYAWSLPRDPNYAGEFLYSVVSGSMPGVAPNGDVFVTWIFGDPYTGLATIFIRKSTNGGDNFGDKITVANLQLYGTEPPYSFFASIPSITVDKFTGFIYISYSEMINNQLRVRFTKSTDGGNNWNIPLNLGIGNYAEDFSSISVDKNGKITVFYRSYRDTYITESFDEGNTFLQPIKVTTQPSIYNPSYGYHYQGLANTRNGDSYCVWTDLRQPNVDIYFSLANSLNFYASISKTVDFNATGVNSQRKIARDSTGNYHFVFSSGGNIYYSNSSNLGGTWSSPINISIEGGKNNLPSIATKGNYLFVVYREFNGLENNLYKYTLRGKWKLINTNYWHSMYIIDAVLFLPNESIDPLPVIIAATNVDNNYNSLQNAPELMIAFCGENGLNHINLFYDFASGETPEYNYRQKGLIHNIPNTTFGFQHPSVAVNSIGEIMLTSDFNGNIYAYTTTGGNWSAIPPFVFNLINMVNNQKSSITSDGTGSFHISWQGENSSNETISILHKKISSIGGLGSPITEFANSQYLSNQPSTFGHMDANGGVSIYWYTVDDLDIKKVVHDGVSWNYRSRDFIPLIQTNARFVNSVDKDSPENYAYCWTSVGELPVLYNVEVNDDIPGESPIAVGGQMIIGEDSTKTYRSAELNVTILDAILVLQLGNFKLINKNGGITTLDLQVLPPDYVFTSFNDVINTLWCDSIPRSNVFRKISFDYATIFKNLSRIKANNSDNILIKFKLIDRKSGNTLYTSNSFVFPSDSTKRTLSGNLVIPFNGLNQRYDLGVNLILEGVANYYLNQTENINLVNTYLTGSNSLGKQNKLKNDIAHLDEYRLDQNYPNPFNPSTKIKYSVQVTSNVMIQIFDILGRKIETLVNEEKLAGEYETTWNAENLPSGIYFYQIQSDSFTETKKMILLK